MNASTKPPASANSSLGVVDEDVRTCPEDPLSQTKELQVLETLVTQVSPEPDRDRLASIFRASPASIIFFSPEGVIENWNPSAEQLFGYTAEESVGRQMQFLCPPETPDEMERVKTLVARDGVVRDFETVRLHKNGSRVDVSLTTSSVNDEHDQLIGYCQIVSDIRERKRLEHQLASALDHERQRLGRELHDSLGQQLTGIGMLVALLKSQDAAGQRDCSLIARLESSLDQAKQQLRLLAKGMFPVDVDGRGLKVALSEMASEFADLYQVPCRFECPQDVLLESNFTATQLYLFTREAVHNAAKHAKAQEIVVRLESERGLRVSICDDGAGVRNGVNESATMGLRIMRYRCSLIGGQMQMSSMPGGGTVIACSLDEE